MKKTSKAAEKKSNDLVMKIAELAEDIREEYDMMELIEDSIKDIFACDLDCTTCSREDQGRCLQNFKKGNLYWLRKIRQDEVMITDIVEKLAEMRLLSVEMYELLKIKLKELKHPIEDEELEKKLEKINTKYKKTSDKKDLYI